MRECVKSQAFEYPTDFLSLLRLHCNLIIRSKKKISSGIIIIKKKVEIKQKYGRVRALNLI